MFKEIKIYFTGNSNDIEELSYDSQQAIQANSFFSEEKRMSCGDVSVAFGKCDHIIQGEVRIGSQEQFYLETQATVAYPGEDDEMIVYTGTQTPSEAQVIT